MADVTGTATSYDLPNYIGEVFFQKSQRPNAFLRLIGGLNGGVRLVTHTEFALGASYQLAAQAQPVVVEGADPVFTEEEVTQGSNVLQIFQEGVSLTYSAESSTDSIGGVAVIPGAGNGELVRPRSMDWQVERAIERIMGQMNVSFLKGAYQKPANNATPRKTRGVRSAITTNTGNLAAAALSKANVESTLQTWMSNGMFNRGDELYVLGDATAIGKLIALFEGATMLPTSRTVVGVQVQQIVTKWATLNVVYEPDCTAAELLFIRPAYIQPVAMVIKAQGQTKGVLFREPLAHSGSKTQEQVYGEWGVDYTDEIFAGVISNYT